MSLADSFLLESSTSPPHHCVHCVLCGGTLTVNIVCLSPYFATLTSLSGHWLMGCAAAQRFLSLFFLSLFSLFFCQVGFNYFIHNVCDFSLSSTTQSILSPSSWFLWPITFIPRKAVFFPLNITLIYTFTVFSEIYVVCFDIKSVNLVATHQIISSSRLAMLARTLIPQSYVLPMIYKYTSTTLFTAFIYFMITGRASI